ISSPSCSSTPDSHQFMIELDFIHCDTGQYKAHIHLNGTRRQNCRIYSGDIYGILSGRDLYLPVSNVVGFHLEISLDRIVKNEQDDDRRVYMTHYSRVLHECSRPEVRF
ncbi:hypothetical protein J6590_106730, partial [Homalodisca vitripennis]